MAGKGRLLLLSGSVVLPSLETAVLYTAHRTDLFSANCSLLNSVTVMSTATVIPSDALRHTRFTPRVCNGMEKSQYHTQYVLLGAQLNRGFE